MNSEGVGASLAVEGATTKAFFEAYIEKVWPPALKPGQTGAHSGDGHLLSQRSWGQETDGGAGRRADVPATLLSRAQPHRGGFREGRRDLEERAGPQPGGLGSSDGRRALFGQ